MEEKKRNIKQEIEQKLNDDVLREALRRFADAYPQSRAKAYENVADIDALRESLKQMKLSTVAQIESIADQFEAEALRRGTKVFRAANGDEVKNYLLTLCKEKNVKRIVKSKSMASEEIHLNQALEAAGFRVKETDLGEWIIALAGQKPSHMVMPAIHLNRQQIAEYFSQELNQEIQPDIPLMVQTARKNLREEFLQADMGITGANFGIAENGAIGLVTNEGNARLVTTLPRIHVVIIGYEKLIPSIKDATPILRTLPRNATGQCLTSYVSMISGQVPTLIKKDGHWIEDDKELHIILLDNGRLKAAKDEKFKQIYQCVRCASCLNVCPVYLLVGGHVYGHIYSGGIGAILTAFLNSMGDFEAINELCIGCRKCTTICPGKIDIPGLIEELRVRSVKEHGLPFTVRAVFDNIISNRKVFHSLLRVASLSQKPFQSGDLIRHLPLFLAGLTKDRSLPAIADTPLRDRVPKITKKLANPVKKAAFFSGCNLDFVFPETGESVYKVLQDLNIQVVFPKNQSCCGKPIIGTGDIATTKKIAKQNIEAFEKADVDYIIAACPSCTETLHVTYAEIFSDDPDWAARAKIFSHKVHEFSHFVAKQYEKAGRLNKKSVGGIKVTMHDSCHMKRVLNIYTEPRKLLENAPGYELIEMKDCDKCCGMAGAFGMKYPELSVPLLKQKIQNARQCGAQIIAVGCPACMMQLKGGLDKQAPEITVKHIADILAATIKR
ncbi:L-lactate dehydrogenase (quinone) large subunit LdhH [Sporomusa sp. KB1]|uniref:L-lactate dehydrogenase (quinone) large subunit LdhH n=1 Tax=Sporomusa sp. KB1 TaxID=943346 RepID=UPI0011ACFA14|nr:LUD domain-containing protein [Sporomusa sp. KB1]TWH48034.1 iron-sulfur cluster protein [Sporomusa sp. KB1]